MIKHIDIIVLKFKENTISIQKDIDIFSKYFLTVHASVVSKKFFQNFIYNTVRQLNKQDESKILKTEKDISD